MCPVGGEHSGLPNGRTDTSRVAVGFEVRILEYRNEEDV